MSFSGYYRYKSTGDPWIKQIPDSWEWARNKRVFRFVSRPVGDQSGDYQLLSLTLRGVVPRDLDGKGKYPAEFSAYQVVKPGNVVFCLFDVDETPRTVGLSFDEGMVTGAYCVADVVAHSDPRFVYYWYLNLDQRKGLRPYYTGLRKVVRPETFMNLEMALPSLAEQKSIAAFLDHETSKIDALIAEQQRLIELLKEKRQAVISHTVTKGLNPNAPMKDSGVEWLGEVPAHWEVIKLKYVVRDKVAGPYGASLTKAMYTNEGYKVYGQQQIISDDFQSGSYYISQEKYNEMTRYTVFPNDVLVTVMGTIGRVSVVPEGVERGIINPRLVRYKFDDGKIMPIFVKLILMSLPYQRHLREESKGSTMEGLNMGILGDVPLLVPPLDEQKDIAVRVTQESDGFRAALSESESLISLLAERRSALISAAVTGKIDVRGWQPVSQASEEAVTYG